MFLKKHIVNKGGKIYEYYRIVASYTDEQGRKKHQIVRYVGALSLEEADKLRRELRKQRNHKPSPAPAREVQAADALQQTVIMIPHEAVQLVCLPRSRKEWHVASNELILLIREGRGELVILGQKYDLPAGTAIYCPADTGIHIANSADRPLLLERVSFYSIAPLNPAGEPGVFTKSAASLFPQEVTLYACTSGIMQLSKELHAAAGDKDGLRIQAQFYQFISALLRSQPTAEGASGDQTVKKALGYIHDYFPDPISREQLAARYGISPEHFSRLFKKETGRGFIDYLNRVRIMKSKELLQLSEASFLQISRQTGFKSEYYFSRKFKKATGVSPTGYREASKTYAALTAYAASCLLTLGIVPRLGVLEPWMVDEYSQRMDLSGLTALDWHSDAAERLLTDTAPDLIFIFEDDEQAVRLRDIGPLCPLQDVYANWQATLHMLAKAVNRRAEAEAWLARYHTKLNESRAMLEERLACRETVVIIKIVSDKIYVYGNSTSMGGYTLYSALGLAPPSAVQVNVIDQGLPNLEVAPQALHEYAANHIFLFNYSSNWFPALAEEVYEAMNKHALAPQTCRIYEPNPDIFYGYDCLSLEKQLDEAVSCLLSHSSP
jgi:AraC-like DNA-binding protein/quercetin dioxygenase-like cupin family protein